MSTEPSSRISTDPDFRYSWYARLFFANQRRRYGKELEPARLWARTPKVFAALSLLYGALDRRRSPIEPALRSLITVRVSQINWCAFCVDINSATGLKRGISYPYPRHAWPGMPPEVPDWAKDRPTESEARFRLTAAVNPK